MTPGVRAIVLAIAFAAFTVALGHADDSTFTALLAKAKEQAAAGHRWSPPGDNMTETIARMMDLVPSATPAQLSELAALLESDKTPPRTNQQALLATPEPPRPKPPSAPEATPVPSTRAALLFARGLEAEKQGDLSGARRFYTSSAQQGDAAAARNLGRLYDPAYIRRSAMGGIDADPALAREWYERAVKMGDDEARPLLEALSTR